MIRIPLNHKEYDGMILIHLMFGIWGVEMESLCCCERKWDVCVCDWTSAKNLWLCALTAGREGCLTKGHIKHEIISQPPNMSQNQNRWGRKMEGRLRVISVGVWGSNAEGRYKCMSMEIKWERKQLNTAFLNRQQPQFIHHCFCIECHRDEMQYVLLMDGW